MIVRRFIRLSSSLLVGLIALVAIGAALNPIARAAATAVRLYPDVFPCNTTLQACIDGSAPGDVIQIKPGAYLAGVTLNKPVSLIGLGLITPTTLIAPLNQRVITITGAVITAGTVISNLHLIGGQLTGADCAADACGGAILLAGTARPSLARLTIDNNSAYQGGGLWADAGPEVVIVDSKIISNSAAHAGGGIYSAADVRLVNTLIERNHSNDNGGGLDVVGALNVTNGTILSNTSSNGGGGARVATVATLNFGRWEGNVTNGFGGGLFASNLIMTGTAFINNEGNGYGGGVYVNGPALLQDGRFERNRSLNFGGGGGLSASSVRASGTQFVGNTALGSVLSGGGAYVSPGFADLKFVRFEGNQAGSGGGLWVGGPVTLTNANLINNQADIGSGGGVYAGGGLSIKDSRLENNVSRASSGGGAFTFGSAQVVNTSFLSNSASVRGGGLAASAGADVQRSQFLRNTGEQFGGGLDVQGALGITGSIFISNSSPIGGGVYHNATGDGRVVNSLFARNVGSASGASALQLASAGHVDVIHTTIADPTWVSPAFNPSPAIRNGTGSLTITNTIVADHSIGISNNGGGAAYEDYNLFSNMGIITSGLVTSGGHNRYPATPQFVDLLNDNYHVLVTSAAIDNGTGAGVHFDVDGQPRPIGPGFDIGFDEYVFSIQAEIDRTPPGGTVFIPSDSYTESVTLYKPVSLIGMGPTPPIVHAAPDQRVITITGAAITLSTVISNLQLTGGDLLTNCSIDCLGGGVLITGQARPQLVNLDIHNNFAMMGGGVYAQTGGARQVNVQLRRNRAGQSGGGMYIEQPGVLIEQTAGSVEDNQAIDGAGVFVQDGRYQPVSTLIFKNNAANWGGGVIVGGTGRVVLEAVTVYSNSATNGGGGFFIDLGSVEMRNGTIFSNTASQGGGVYLLQPSAAFTLISGLMGSNRAITAGGGLYVDQGRANIIDGQIISNTADTYGGGIAVGGPGSVKLSGQWRVAGNTANGTLGGGGLFVQTGGQATLLGGRVESNSAVGYGGGLYAGSGFVVTGTKFFNNTAADGGAIYHTGSDPGRISNVFVAGNSPTAANANGASVSLNSTGVVSVAYATFGNAATTTANITGRAIEVRAGYVKMVNSIVASYSIGISRTAGTVSEDYNLFFGTPLSLTGVISSGGHSRTGLDPQFVNPLSGDYHIRSTSPAINRALDVGVRRDIDLDGRPIGGGYDVGADETQGAGVTIAPGTISNTILIFSNAAGGSTQVTIPPGAITIPPTATFACYYTPISSDTITAPLPSRLRLSGSPFEIDGFIGDEEDAAPVSLFNVPITITIRYAEAELNGISEQTLKLYRLEKPPFGTGWCAIGVCRPNESQTLDTANNVITATVTGFSKWGRYGADSAYELFLPLIMKN